MPPQRTPTTYIYGLSEPLGLGMYFWLGILTRRKSSVNVIPEIVFAVCRYMLDMFLLIYVSEHGVVP